MGAPPRVAADDAPVRSRSRKGVVRFTLMALGIMAAAGGGLTYWLHGGRYVSIDNAYVRAAKIAISTDIGGTVTEVSVREGSRVAAGDVLVRIEQYKFRIALEGAKANLAQAVLGVEAMKRDYQRMLRDVEAREAMVQGDTAAFERYGALVKSGGVTRADYDDIRFRLAANRAAVQSLTEQARVQLARLGGNADIDPADTPAVRLAQSQVDEAQRQLAKTIVTAPFAGIVTQVETLQPGMYLSAAAPAFGLVSTDRIWVEANPKETDLTHVKPGDPVHLTIDTYPGRVWTAWVESIAPASTAEFSVLPAQNASGNWVKVVQRNPLRVRVDRLPGDPDLRAGMSAVVEIDTGHVRHLSDLWKP
jgi:membrane fusion protein (multidrug efflux system)